MNPKIKQTLIKEITEGLKDDMLSAQVEIDIDGFDIETHNDPISRRFAQIEANRSGFPF